jgi:hypothetical protein
MTSSPTSPGGRAGYGSHHGAGRRWLLASVGIAVLASACAAPHKPTEQQIEATVTALEEVSPSLEPLGVTQFRDLNGCRLISYARGSFSTRGADPTCNPTSEPAIPFDAQADEDYAVVRSILNTPEISVVTLTTYPDDSGAGVPSRVFDVANPSNENWSYVYQPSYVLPGSVPGESESQSIDEDWYLIWQDWN